MVALRTGSIIRVRQGWYAETGRNAELIRAARVGGRATCSTALDLLGFWVVGDGHLHVRVGPHATQLRHSRDRRRRLVADPAGVRVHWNEHAAHRSRLIVSPMDALRDYAVCARAELVGASAESIAHRRPDLRAEIRRFAAERRRTLRRVLDHVDGVSESGTEFLIRWRLLRTLPMPVVPQAEIPGVGRVDFLIGARLVIEVDSRKYHTDPAAFEADRRRDAALSIRGIRVLRFSYHQVLDEPAAVEAAVRAALARGDAW